MMQVFNEINARKIGEKEYNVFKGFFNNFFFLGIIIFSVVVQVLMVIFGGEIVRVGGLTWQHHLICILIGAFSLVVGKQIFLVTNLTFRSASETSYPSEMVWKDHN
jgi:hypothetical protein